MIAVGIRYLCGWAVATDPASYEDAEWPPHPARVFMAMAAAHFETRDDPPSPAQEAERRALEWLEGQEPPALRVSAADRTEPVTAYVPVNDPGISVRSPESASRKTVEGSLTVLPARRSRQPRTFPRVIPQDDTVWLLWPGADVDDAVREGLDDVCRKVTRIGHSSSLVQMWLADDGSEPSPSLVPNDSSPTTRLRIPASGLLSELEALFEADLRPSVSLWARYGRPEPSAGRPHSLFDPRLLVLRLRPGESTYQRLGLASTAKVIDYFRRAVISAASDPVPEYISGHLPDGSPSRKAHAAFLPLAFVGHRHSDGHLLGLAVALPHGLDDAERRRVEEAIAVLVSHPDDEDDAGRLVMGRLGRWRLEPVVEAAPPFTLRPETWTAPAASWASVTPLVLDRFTHDEKEKREVVADACEFAGLPRPADVRLSHVSPFRGAPPSPEFGPLRVSGRKAARPFTHALVRFGDAEGKDLRVQGPVLLGAGRYRGYGLFRPFR